ncbi:hypothetical protein HW555_000044 [Spodoptera exigua]|uniref:Uncharacterized protein n=1 Tax=Spodoptera exigua TaxID=7107 RepID=A0A835GV36_SPOEX|nr:hypothetical protein HW555_000044 [Spodoptera exigua]
MCAYRVIINMKFIMCLFLFLVLLEGFQCAPYRDQSTESPTETNRVITIGERNIVLVGGVCLLNVSDPGGILLCTDILHKSSWFNEAHYTSVTENEMQSPEYHIRNLSEIAILNP